MTPLTSDQRLVLGLAAVGLVLLLPPLGYWWIKGWRYGEFRDLAPVALCIAGANLLLASYLVNWFLSRRGASRDPSQ